MKEFNFILLGWSLAMTAIACFMAYLLYKKPTTEIKGTVKQRGRNTSNNVSDISVNERKKDIDKGLNKLFNKLKK